MDLTKAKMIEQSKLCQYRGDCKSYINGSCNGDCRSGLNHQVTSTFAETGK